MSKYTSFDPKISVKTVSTHFRSLSPMYMGRPVSSKRKDNEAYEEWEARVWKEKCNALPDGRLFIPPQAFRGALISSAQLLSEKIPGKRNQTWSKQFVCGVIVAEGMILPATLDTVKEEWIYVPSDGKPGGGTRVWKCFPRIDQWEGDLTWYITAPTITMDVFVRISSPPERWWGLGRSE